MEQHITCDDLIGYIWDTYKEIHGIRPRWMDLDNMSIIALDILGRELAAEADAYWAQREQDLAADEAEFDAEVELMLSHGAETRAKALQWMMDAANVRDEFALEGWLITRGLCGSKRWNALMKECMALLPVEEAA